MGGRRAEMLRRVTDLFIGNSPRYSEAEIRAFIDDPAEKARMRDEARAYLAGHGVTRGDAESYCRLGRAEIAAGSRIGQLIYEH